ncbi:four helix bundle protein [Danxiaibacter flavus]|uniref:Four helix bundle protein n=1 Tax=Danxiaibacter flavus TaxID=3049108 RepID=A0ABV3ZAY9_9BACT|nr:four helix bundle protein [Chitinophagaceae bacterium DXS]
MNGQPNPIVTLSFAFALEIIEFCDQLEEKRKYTLANQLLRSGTSIGANVKEAQAAESKKDFVHKMKIAYKEAEETIYWLKLCEASKSYPNPNRLLLQLETLLKILGKIISTSKKTLAL